MRKDKAAGPEVGRVKIMSRIQQISDIRANNNILWMRLLSIALESSPSETKRVLKQINCNDGEISRLLGEIADDIQD